MGLIGLVLAVSFPLRAAAQLEGRFERIDADLGLRVDGPTVASAWADADGDGDLDLTEVDGEGRITLWLQTEGTFSPVSLGSVESPTFLRWLDADGDGTVELLLGSASVQGANLLEVDLASDPAVGSEVVSITDNAALSIAEVDVDGDGQLDFFVGSNDRPTQPAIDDGGDQDVPAAAQDVRSGLILRRGGAYAAASIDGFEPTKDQRLAVLYRAGVDDDLELYTGQQDFPRHRFVIDPAGSRYLGSPSQRVDDVADLAVGDFDGDLVNEMFALRVDVGSAVAVNEERTEWSFLLSTDSDVQSLSVVGVSQLDVDVVEVVNLPVFAIQFGQERRQADSYQFTLADGLGPGTTVRAGVDTGLFIDQPAEDRFRFTLTAAQQSAAVIRLRSETPIDVVDAIGRSPLTGAVSDAFITRRDAVFEVAQLLPSATECRSVVAIDIDNDMDLDLYLGCGNDIEPLANRLFVNDGAGTFREEVLVDGALGDMGQVLGTSAADVDDDGWPEILVAAGGGVGIERRAALLSARPNGNNWIGFDLVTSGGRAGALGASVLVEAGGIVQRRDVLAAGVGASQDDGRLLVGLGPNETADRVTVRWPSGRFQVLDDLAANAYVSVLEPSEDSSYADIDITELEVNPAVREGDRITVALTLANQGNVANTEGSVVFELPEGWSPRGLPPEVAVLGGTVEWPLPGLDPSAEGLQILLRVAVEDAVGPAELVVTVDGDFPPAVLSTPVVTSGAPGRSRGAIALGAGLVGLLVVVGFALWRGSRQPVPPR